MNKGLVERAFEFVLAALFVMGLALVWNTKVHAAEPPKRCFPMDFWKPRIERVHGNVSSLNGDQWQFARAMSALSPDTPPGLPYGDGAELVTMPDGSGLVLFVDGPLACDPMAIPAPIIAILKSVGEGKITREGDAL